MLRTCKTRQSAIARQRKQKNRSGSARITNTPQKQKFTTVASCSGRVMAALQAELQSTPMRTEMGRKLMEAAEKRRELIRRECVQLRSATPAIIIMPSALS